MQISLGELTIQAIWKMVGVRDQARYTDSNLKLHLWHFSSDCFHLLRWRRFHRENTPERKPVSDRCHGRTTVSEPHFLRFSLVRVDSIHEL